MKGDQGKGSSTTITIIISLWKYIELCLSSITITKVVARILISSVLVLSYNCFLRSKRSRFGTRPIWHQTARILPVQTKVVKPCFVAEKPLRLTISMSIQLFSVRNEMLSHFDMWVPNPGRVIPRNLGTPTYKNTFRTRRCGNISLKDRCRVYA